MEPEFRAMLQERRIQELEMRTLFKDMAIYIIYVIVIFMVSYGNRYWVNNNTNKQTVPWWIHCRDPNAFLAKDAIQQAVVHGALNCGILPEDDPAYQECDDDDVPEPYIDFMKVRDANEWW